MNFVTATSEAAARALQDKAFRYCIDVLGCYGGAWSEVYKDADGITHGIVFEPMIDAALSPTEKGARTVGTGQTATVVYDAVKSGKRKVTDAKGVVTGTWIKVETKVVKDKEVTMVGDIGIL